jgi:5-methylcytosine-specific restriction enzyme A
MLQLTPRNTPHLCSQPYCTNIVEGAGRCPEHRTNSWQTATVDRTVYGHAWRKIRDVCIAQHPTCQRCHQRPSKQVHHLDHNPRNNQPSNLAAWCARCHRAETGRWSVEQRRRAGAKT